MNAVSLFGANPTVGACLELMLGLSVLSMASALAEWDWLPLQSAPASLCVPVSGFLALAAASAMAAIMQPELVAAAFGVI